MKVTGQYWQAMPDGALYRPDLAETRRQELLTEQERLPGSYRNTSDTFSEAMQGKTTEKMNGDFKMKSSGKSDSVGELAAMLARAETRLDVQQVASKAMRALTSLKMSSVGCEGKEAKKIARQIRRMEKLIKRIHKKLEHLAKEERLGEQQKRAEKKQEEQKAKQIREELRSKRGKRRRDEREYARKELAEDGKEQIQEMTSSMMNGMGSASASPDGISFADMDMPAAAVDGVSIDVSV